MTENPWQHIGDARLKISQAAQVAMISLFSAPNLPNLEHTSLVLQDLNKKNMN
jgi:hypothetical protein